MKTTNIPNPIDSSERFKRSMEWNDFIQTPAIGWSDPLITGAKLLALAILTE